MLARLLSLLLTCTIGGWAQAADFSCTSAVPPQALGSFGRLVPGPRYPDNHPLSNFDESFRWEGGGGVQAICTTVTVAGKIVEGDAGKTEWLIERGQRDFSLQSPGGDLLEGITIGRLLRSAHARANARDARCGGSGQPVCCASACAIAYLGATQWTIGDRLGLHRPTLADMGRLDYSEARSRLDRATAWLGSYLREMEADEDVLKRMMSASPDRLAIYAIRRKFAPLLEDWLREKCKRNLWVQPPTTEDIEYCMSSRHGELNRDLIEEAQRLDWFSDRSDQELSSMILSRSKVGSIRSAAAQRESDKRLVKRMKPRIDAMPVEQLREYIRKEFIRSSAEQPVSIYAYERLEKLTGDRVIGSPLSDCLEALDPELILSSCTKYISKKREERAEVAQGHDQLLEAMLRRIDAFRTLQRGDEALEELNDLIEAIEAKTLPISMLDSRISDVYEKRAVIRKARGEFPGVIDDLTKAMKGVFSSKREALLIMRAATYEQIGELDKAAADRGLVRALKSLP